MALENLIQKHTETITLTDKNPAADTHLLYLWAARRGLVKRWERPKHNHTLKKRIAAMTLQATQ